MALTKGAVAGKMAEHIRAGKMGALAKSQTKTASASTGDFTAGVRNAFDYLEALDPTDESRADVLEILEDSLRLRRGRLGQIKKGSVEVYLDSSQFAAQLFTEVDLGD